MSAPTLCAKCSHRNRGGNCNKPVEAGLSSTFIVIFCKYIDQGRACRAWTPKGQHQ